MKKENQKATWDSNLTS